MAATLVAGTDTTIGRLAFDTEPVGQFGPADLGDERRVAADDELVTCKEQSDE